MPYLRTLPNGPAGKLAAALKGRRQGRGWVALCPAHTERTASLKIDEGPDGKVLIHCFGGCDQQSVISVLRQRGLWEQHNAIPTVEQMEYRRRDDERRVAERIASVSRIWNDAQNPQGTPAEQYLHSRRLTLPPELCGSVLRYHPTVPFEGDILPCLLAAFRSIETDKLTAIHRIRLDQPERWPKAQRMMLGAVAGSAVKLDPAGDRLVVGEGIETALAARQLGLRPVWALGSSGGIKALLPITGVEAITILGERDNGSNLNAARECCNKWQPRSVFLAMPPTGFKDFNDFLMERKNAAA
jgi:hypothetical protein